MQAAWRRAWLARGVDVTDGIGRGAALVIAPHPDDETFGCGVVVLRKRDQGTPVTVAIVTDGGGSHGGDEQTAVRVARQREAEARTACRRLGVDDDHLVFLGFRDGAVGNDVDSLAARLRELLDERRPAQVFVPVSCDGHTDHNATNRALRLALARRSRPDAATVCAAPDQPGGRVDPEVWEYPISLWAHWPYTRVRDGRRGRLRRALLAPFARLRDARPRLVRVDGYRDRKAAAMAAYASQTGPRAADEAPALTDAFVRSFLGPHEVFLPFRALGHLNDGC
jgi:LmbE family N-acetylglucosaminyl deacetylase